MNLSNKKICFLGLGSENLALLKYLDSANCKLQTNNADITICDFKDKKELKHRFLNLSRDINFRSGKDYKDSLEEFDIVFRSPGFPLFDSAIKKAQKAGVEISSPMKVFFKICPTQNIIGVTGSKGKGTTASLIFHILKKAKKNVYLGGNIGIAPFEFFNKLQKSD